MKKSLLLIGGMLISAFYNNCRSQTFTSSNLPIVVIDTYGQYIDTAYQTFVVGMGVIDHGPGVRNYLTDPFNAYNDKAEIKLHGSSTLWFPKKSYGVTTLTSMLDKNDVALMGLPKEHDWIFKGLYQDKTFLRDDISFRIANQMGHYASRSIFFELVVNGDYRGVYQLEEKVKRDHHRVDIPKLKPTDVSGDALTGGYIVKLDKIQWDDQGWYSDYPSNITSDSADFYIYEYPKADSMPVAQKDYIKNYIKHFEDVMVSSYFADPDSGYSKYVDVNSFIDNFIVNELSRNVDGYRCSSFFYKDKDSDGGKLHCGPVWDYNIAWDNANYNGGNNSYGWQYQVYATQYYVPFWWWQFMSDNTFKNELKCRYQQLRANVLSIPSLYAYVDSMAIYLDESQTRNFTRWPIMGTYVWPNPSPIPPDYPSEIGALKYWIQARLNWLDANMPGVCTSDIAELNPGNLLYTYPNPFDDHVNVSYTVAQNCVVSMDLFDIAGKEIEDIHSGMQAAGSYDEQITTDNLRPGIYLLKLTMNGKAYYSKIIKV
ncbi:MAG: CotH kinase family protein [Bacteroidia bacterium]